MFGISFPLRKLRSVELPMKENVSGYSRNPCSLNRERDAAFAAKLLTLPTGFFSAEKSEEWMNQPMNWRDSIWVQTRSRSGRSRCISYAASRSLFREQGLRE